MRLLQFGAVAFLLLISSAYHPSCANPRRLHNRISHALNVVSHVDYGGWLIARKDAPLGNISRWSKGSEWGKQKETSKLMPTRFSCIYRQWCKGLHQHFHNLIGYAVAGISNEYDFKILHTLFVIVRLEVVKHQVLSTYFALAS